MNPTTWTVATYLAYLALAVPLTVWVARTLSANGAVFLADVFTGNEDLAKAVNKLLVVGFYLVNLGFVSLYLRTGDAVTGLQQLVEQLSVKVGVVALVLGLVHFTNVFVFNQIRKRHRLEQLRTAPVAPQAQVPPAGWGYPTYPTQA